jgi:hypothetical protein
MKLMLLSLVFIFSFSLSGICQPPWPSTPPLGMETEGTIPEPIDVEYELSGTVRFKTINNTDCDIDFQTWFVIAKKDINGNIIDTYTGKITYFLDPKSQGQITNFQIFDLIELPKLPTGSTNYYEIIATGIFIKFGAMSGYIDIYPNHHGQTFYFPNLEEPCNCFKTYFNFTATKVTLTIEPCVY